MIPLDVISSSARSLNIDKSISVTPFTTSVNDVKPGVKLKSIAVTSSVATILSDVNAGNHFKSSTLFAPFTVNSVAAAADVYVHVPNAESAKSILESIDG